MKLVFVSFWVLLSGFTAFAGVVNKTGKELDNCQLRAVYFAAGPNAYIGPNEPSADLIYVDKYRENSSAIQYFIRIVRTWDGDAPTGGEIMVLGIAKKNINGTCDLPVKFPIVETSK